MSLGATLYVLSNGAESTGPCLAVDVHRVSAVSGERTALQQVLVNAGECSTRILTERGIKLNATDIALFTRCAPDTLAGLPALIFHLADRGAPDITLVGPPPLRQYHDTVQSFVHRRYPRVATDESPFFSYSCGIQFNPDGGGATAASASSRPGLPRYSWASAKLAAAAAQSVGRGAAFRGRVTELVTQQADAVAGAASASSASTAGAAAARNAASRSASPWQVQLPAPGTTWAGVTVHTLPIRRVHEAPAMMVGTACPCRAACPALSSVVHAPVAPLPASASASAAASCSTPAPPAAPASAAAPASSWRDSSEIDLDDAADGSDDAAGATAAAPAGASAVPAGAAGRPDTTSCQSVVSAAPTCACVPQPASLASARATAASSATIPVDCHCYLITISGPALEDEEAAGVTAADAGDDTDDVDSTDNSSGDGSVTSGTITDDEDATNADSRTETSVASETPGSAAGILKRGRPPSLDAPSDIPPTKRRKVEAAAAAPAAASTATSGAGASAVALRSTRLLVVDVPLHLGEAVVGSSQHHCGACTRAPASAAAASVCSQLREHLSPLLQHTRRPEASSEPWAIVHLAPCSIACTPWYRTMMVQACAACRSDGHLDGARDCTCLHGALRFSGDTASRVRVQHVFVHECARGGAALAGQHGSGPASPVVTHFPALLRQSVRLHVAAPSMYPDPAYHDDAARALQSGRIEPSALLHDGLRLLGRSGDGTASNTSGVFLACPSPVDADDVAADARACLAAASGVRSLADATSVHTEAATAAGALKVVSAAVNTAAQQLQQRADPALAFLGTGAAAPSKRRSCSGVYTSTAPVALADVCTAAPSYPAVMGSAAPMRDCCVQGGFLLDVGEGCLSRLQLLAPGLLMRSASGGGPASDISAMLPSFSALDSIIAGLSFVWVSHMHADHHTGLPRLLQARHAVAAAISAASGGSLQLQPLVVTGPAALRQAVSMYLQLLPPMPAARGGAVQPVAVFVALSDFAPSCARSGDLGLASACAGAAELVAFRTFVVEHSCREAYGCTATLARRCDATSAVESEAIVVVYSGDTRPCSAVVDAGMQACVAQLAPPPSLPTAPRAVVPMPVAAPMMMMPVMAPHMHMVSQPMAPMMPMMMPMAMHMAPPFVPGMMPGHMHGFPVGPAIIHPVAMSMAAMGMGMPFPPQMTRMMMAPPMPMMVAPHAASHHPASMHSGPAAAMPASVAVAGTTTADAPSSRRKRVNVSVLLIHEATFDDDRTDDAVAKRHATVGEALSVGSKLAAAVEQLNSNLRGDGAGACRFVGTVLTHFSQRYPKLISGATSSPAAVAVAVGASSGAGAPATPAGLVSSGKADEVVSAGASHAAGAAAATDDESARRRICAFDGLALPLLPLSRLHDDLFSPAACGDAHAAIERVLEPLAPAEAAAGDDVGDDAVATDVPSAAADASAGAF